MAIASSSQQERLNSRRQAGKKTENHQTSLLFFKRVFGNGIQDDLRELKIDPLASQPLDELLEAAIEKQKADREKTRGNSQSDLYVREIYLFTDLSRKGWGIGRLSKIREDLKKYKWLRLYLVDVGVEKPANVAVTALSLSKQVLWPGEDLHIDVRMKTVGEHPIKGTLKLWITDSHGKDQLRKSIAVILQPGVDKTVQLSAGALPASFNQGRVQFVPDPEEPSHLVADDSRFLSVASRKKPKVLIVSDYKADTKLWRNALQPERLAEHEAWFVCDYRPTSLFLREDLATYDVVYLINVRTPTAKMWTKLTKFVQDGGGLGVILGSNDDDETQIAYDRPEARKLLPGEILAYKKFSRPQFLLLERNLEHPIISSFKDFGQGELEGQAIYKCWRVKSYQKNNVIAEYTHRSKIPALLVHGRGSGQVVLMTTAVGRRGDWNDLSLGPTYMLLAHRMTQFLTGQGGRKYNFIPGGEPVSLHFGGRTKGRPVLLRKPGAQVGISSSGRSLDLDQDQLDRIGNYQVIGNDKNKSVLAAFSYNFSPDQTDLTRLTEKNLEEMLGKGRFQRARDIKSLNRAVSGDRYGKEIYELVLLGMICAFCGELLVANRFYSAEQANEHQ
ncbi:MAG: hypothetical protein IID45_14785 [Planctomycetes bacterium]|nr:hypothetical protein [Planctomycetota bacterium]